MRENCAKLGGVMHFCLAVFRSRNETLYLANMLNMSGFRVAVINTPKDAGLACGISVRFDENAIEVVKRFICSKPFRSFSGFYRVINEGNRNSYQKIG